MQKGHDRTTQSCLSCPNSMVLVLTVSAVDIGAYPAFFAKGSWLVRRMDATYKQYFLVFV